MNFLINYLKQRKFRKVVRHLLYEARHARHMREDVAEPEKLKALQDAESSVKKTWERQDWLELKKELERLSACTAIVYPTRPRAKVREYVEILVVAVTIAMSFRTYFVQPFRIPTGSMQPTLSGITVEERDQSYPFPLNAVRLALFGERYVEIRAPMSGVVQGIHNIDSSRFAIQIGDMLTRPIPRNMPVHVSRGSLVRRDQVVASGLVRSGDHIFVNKVKYNFMRPDRGDIFVFHTEGLDHPQVQIDSYYIKRLVGLPGEEVSIMPPYLIIDGERVTSPSVFHRQVYAEDEGYRGYLFPSRRNSDSLVLGSPRDRVRLGPTEYFPLGDYTRQSLDGRYFGAVEQESIVGPAFMVYWPLGRRWGLVD